MIATSVDRSTRVPEVTVVIPVLNGWDLTEQCLAALEADRTAGTIAAIVAVDDGSTDGTRERIAADRRVTGVLLERNVGFAGACNAGARAAPDAQAYLFLNNDAFVTAGAIARLRSVLADPSIGIVGPLLVYADGTIQNAGMAFSRAGIEVLHYHLDGNLPDAAIARDYPAVTGAALLIRGDLHAALGGFDPQYVNGIEDVDLCLRAWRRGFRVRYEPAARIVHVEGATRGRTPAENQNLARFWAGSGAARNALPMVRIPAAPAYSIDMRGAGGAVERTLAVVMHDGLRRFGGAPVRLVANGGDAMLGRTRAYLEGRKTFTVAVGSARHRADALFCAPRNSVEASAAVAAPVRAWWAPTQRTVARLLAAGAPPDQTHLVFLGAFGSPLEQHAADPSGVAIVVDGETIGLAHDVRSAVGELPVTFIALDAQTADACARTQSAAVVCTGRDLAAAQRSAASATLVVALGEDAYGAIVPLALAAGRRIVTIGDGRAAWCTDRTAVLAAPDALAQCCATILADPALLDDRSAAAQRDAARRFSILHGIARIRELARAGAHGPVDGATVEISPAIARRLRQAG